jgi:LuxR family transcriptional activator of rhlAB and lasB
MTCECVKWCAQIDAAFDQVRGLNDIGRILELEAAGCLFQQAILVMKSPVPFTRPAFYLMTGKGRPALHQGGNGRFSGLERVSSRSVASADVMIWSQGLDSDDSLRWACPESDLGAYGITYAALGAGSTLYSISYTRDGPAVTAGEKGATAWKLRYLNDLVRRHCVALNLFEGGAPALTEREIEVLRWTADGKCANDVATILGISGNTVNYHLKQISKKMNCNSKLQAATYAAAINLI